MSYPPLLCRILITAGLATGSLPGVASADPAGDTSDPVSGYQCLSASCNSVRLPNANCVCVKQNPGETDVRRLVMNCYTGHIGHWTRCPVKPGYGIMENDR